MPEVRLIASVPCKLLDLDAGGDDALAPFFRLRGHVAGEILRRADLRPGAELREACHQFVRLEDIVDCRIELVDDARWRAGRRKDAAPQTAQQIRESAFN